MKHEFIVLDFLEGWTIEKIALRYQLEEDRVKEILEDHLGVIIQ